MKLLRIEGHNARKMRRWSGNAHHLVHVSRRVVHDFETNVLTLTVTVQPGIRVDKLLVLGTAAIIVHWGSAVFLDQTL